KLAGNSGDYSVQALTAFQPRSYASVGTADGRTTDRLAAEAAQATAVRVRKKLGEGTVAGVAATLLDPFTFSGRHALAVAADGVAYDDDRDWDAAVQFG